MRAFFSVWLLCAGAISIEAQTPSETWRDPSPHAVQRLEVDGVGLHYLDWGGRGPLVVLLHGWGSNAHTFDELAPRLTDRFRVVGLTLRGFGESDKPADGYSIQRYADDVHALQRHLGAERAILVGHSFGGWVMTRIATTRPKNVDRLIYLDATFDMPRSDSIIGLRPFQRPGTVRSEAEYYPWLQQYFYGMWSPALEAEARVNAKTRTARAANVALEEARRTPEAWSRLTMPALAICAIAEVRSEFPWITIDSSAYGAAKRYVDQVRAPFQSAECGRFAKTAPRSRTLELVGGHFIHAARLDDVARAIRVFLSE